MEARDASGTTVQAPFGIMAVPQCMLGAFGIIGVLALVGAIFAIRWGGGFGWTFGILAALLALAGIGFVAFAMWGHFAGMPWTFS